MSDPRPPTIAAAAAAIGARELAPAELLELVLARLDETEPQVQSYTHVAADEARATAAALSAEVPRGPLHGVPFAVKDVLATAGMPTECGSLVLRGNVPTTDATAVARLRRAGAVLVGKHVTHEFAFGQNVPPTRNPWALDRYPGGSSAGSGASVAAGSSLAALGTDAGGSVRKPAAVTGVVGLKPTHGRVSGAGTVAGATTPSLDHVGVFARTVEDCALVLAALAGHDPADPRSLAEPVPDYLAALGRPIAGLRIGVVRDLGGIEPEPEVGAAFEEALRELEALGARLVAVELDSARLAVQACMTIFLAEAAPPHRRWLPGRAAEYDQATRIAVELGLIVPSLHAQAAERIRARLRLDAAALYRDARLDLLATPTLPRAAIALAEMRPATDVPAYIPFTSPWNLTGQPALSVPAGFTASGLPIGLQLVGRPFDEETVLLAGHAFELATPWRDRHPGL